MEVINLSILRGPNYWSNCRKKLIVMKLDLLEFENYPTNELDGFNEALKNLMPSLYQHRCSVGTEGGFFKRLESGTWLGHVIEHIALELQWLAGMECGFGRTRPTAKKGVYNVVFSYEVENAGVYAAHAAVNIAKALSTGKQYLTLEQDISELKNIYDNERLGPSTEAIIYEAQKKEIPYMRLDNHSLIMLGQGCNQKMLCSTTSNLTSCTGADIATDKEKTKLILATNHIPVPKGLLIESLGELEAVVNKLGFPLVIKPQSGNHGKGITTNIRTMEKAIFAYNLASKFSYDIIVEKYISGFDYRLLVVNHKLVAVAKRTPACIVGDGKSTIQELIDEANDHPDRGEGHQNFLTKILVDEATRSILIDHEFTLETILPKSYVLYLKSGANISSGGTAIDVTPFVHPTNAFMAERIARLIDLDICGIDIVAEDISTPITDKNGAVIEVNAGPGLRMHLSPSKGRKRNVAKPIVDMLFPSGTPARIPLVAVTGTNGKTTTVRLIAYFARKAGYSVGYTTTEGIYIQDQEIYQGDCSGPLSASVILRDPIVNYGVLECARGGILRSGLGFDQCSISVITNVSEDHLGQDDINTLEEMARVKSVVARSTLDNGYAILNADDDLVYAMRDDLNCNIALFSMSNKNERVAKHCAIGGIAAYIEIDTLILQKGAEKYRVAKVTEIPLSFAGCAKSMIKNILPSILVAFISHFDVQDIAKWLLAFKPSPENVPGRMNLFSFSGIKILIDYAHNEEAFIELRDFIDQINCNRKIGIVAATGDRRLEDIKKVGFYAAQTFNEIIIRQDRDSRGRTHDELTKLIVEGIKQYNPDCPCRVIPSEFDAIQYAIDNAEPNTFIMYFPDEILKAVEYVKARETEQSHLDLLRG